jgi:hypothetical protein
MRSKSSNRRAKDSANRNLVALKAALNRALESRLISSDFAWRTVKAFEKVSRRRERFLEPEQRRKLLKACPADLRALHGAAIGGGAAGRDCGREAS